MNKVYSVWTLFCLSLIFFVPFQVQALDNTQFYGSYEVEINVDECATAVFDDVMTIGSNENRKEDIPYYIYLPPSGDSITYSFEEYHEEYGHYDTITVTISIENSSQLGPTLVIDETGQRGDDPDKGWSVNAEFNFSDDYDSFTVSGMTLDDDPDECEGEMSGSGRKIKDDAGIDNTKFYGSYEVEINVDECTTPSFDDIMTIGNDENRKEDIPYYIYLPPSDDSITYSYEKYSEERDNYSTSTVTISVEDSLQSSPTIVIDQAYQRGGDPDNEEIHLVEFNFSDDYDSFTVSGMKTDDDPNECEGELSGSGRRIEDGADGSSDVDSDSGCFINMLH